MPGSPAQSRLCPFSTENDPYPLPCGSLGRGGLSVCLCWQEVLRVWHQVLPGAQRFAGHVVGLRGRRIAESQETNDCVCKCADLQCMKCRHSSRQLSNSRGVRLDLRTSPGCPSLLSFLLCPLYLWNRGHSHFLKAAAPVPTLSVITCLPLW